MNSVFSEQILADKLSKLNSTQQCIETLSHWCIFHRSKAEVVVATWNEQFHRSQMTQKIPLLYLANDIMQNSKHKGNEFVTEFWKVLPLALKDVNEKDDDQGKKVVSKLVKIWEERRIFGSRAQNLKDVMLGDEAPPPLEFSKKRSRSVKIVRRDSRSIRTKLSIGGSAEKIVSAFHLVHSEQSTEDSEMNRCKSAVNRVRKMEHDVDIACAQVKDPRRKTLAKELEEEENVLKECTEKLKSVEANRVALVTQLREALQEQESELENIRTQMQVAQAQSEEANNMRKRLTDENYTSATSIHGNANTEQKSKKTAADIAAEVADKLAASSSSQFIMSSVLSTFAAEEAKNAGLAVPVSSALNSMPKLEQSTSVSDPNGIVPDPTQPGPAPTTPAHQYQSILITQQPTLHSPSPSAQSQYQLLPNTATQQYAQASRGVTAYGYGSLPPLPPGPPPPLPLPPHIMGPMMHLVPSVQQSAPLTQPQSMLLMQQPPGHPGFRLLQPHGMLYFTQPHHLQ